MFELRKGDGLEGGNPQNFKKIYDATFNVLFKVVYRIVKNEEVSEDIIHESYIKMYEKNMNFPSVDDAKYWLLRVAKNGALNYVKRKERERRAYEKALKEDTRSMDSGETILLKDESCSKVQEALDKLPEKLRTVLILKEYSDMNYKEIGRILGITEGNVRVRVFRAREQLANIIGKDEIYVP